VVGRTGGAQKNRTPDRSVGDVWGLNLLRTAKYSGVRKPQRVVEVETTFHPAGRNFYFCARLHIQGPKGGGLVRGVPCLKH